MSCSAARCAGASRSTGRIAAPTGCATTNWSACRRCGPTTTSPRSAPRCKRRGFKALKTNILPFDGEKLVSFGPGFGRTPGHPELNVDRKTLQAVRDTLAAFRDGAGPDMGLHLDVNYHFKTEGNLQVAKAVEPFDLTWLEIDTWDPQSLALIRSRRPARSRRWNRSAGGAHSGRSWTPMPPTSPSST